METTVRRTGKRQKKKRQKDRKSLKTNDGSPSRNLGLKQATRKEKKRIKQITKLRLKAVSEGFYNQQILYDPQHETCEGATNNPADQTIDLCGADESEDSAVAVPTVEVKPRNEVIDLSKDLSDWDDVIDLTETTRTPLSDCNGDGSLEPAVIDITDEETIEKPSGKFGSDEIVVIGTFRKETNSNDKYEICPSFIPLEEPKSSLSNLISSNAKHKTKYSKKQLVLDRIGNTSFCQYRKNILKSKGPITVTKVGENISVGSPVTFPSKGLRPVIIDGSNVAYIHSDSKFSCKRLEICINYFKKKGHKVTAFVPQYRMGKSDNPQLLRELEKNGDVVFTPSKNIDGRRIVPYDDRFIVQTAALKGGIIVSRDNFKDLLRENPAWAETIKYRTLSFAWVDDVLIFPKDPLGEFGPSLEEFLRFN